MSFNGNQGSSNQQSSQNYSNNAASSGNQTAQYANGPVNSQQILAALNQGQQLYTNGNALTNAGLSNVNTGAQRGMSLVNGGADALTNFIAGPSLQTGNSNPYFGSVVNQLGRSLAPTIAGQFEGLGRYGSGAAANAFADAITNEAGQLGYQNYNQGVQNQLTASLGLPSFTAGMSNPGQAQITAGYAPLNQYVQQLQALNPGTMGSGTSVSNNNSYNYGNSQGVGQGSTSNFGVNAQAKK